MNYLTRIFRKFDRSRRLCSRKQTLGTRPRNHLILASVCAIISLSVHAETPLKACPVALPSSSLSHSDDPQSPIHGYAEHMEWQQDTVYLQNGVKLTQNNAQLIADQASVNIRSGDFEAHHHIRFDDGNISLNTEHFSGNFKQKTGELPLTNFTLATQNARGSAKRVELIEQNKVHLHGTSYTTCPPGDKSWGLTADQILLDRDKGVGIAKNVVLHARDYPLLFFPYFTFPIDDRRRSGWLFPEVSASNQSGLDITTPYYWNIAPNYDATFFPRFTTEHGLLLGTEARYLTTRSEGKWFAEQLLYDPQKLKDPLPEHRYQYHLVHKTQFNTRWSSNFDVAGVSDNRYFKDLGVNNATTNVDLLSRYGALHYQQGPWSFEVLANTYQLINVIDGPYERLPQMRLASYFPSRHGLFYQFQVELSRFDKDNAVTGDRVDIESGVSMPYETFASFVKPSLKLRHTYYQQRDPQQLLPKSVSRTVPVFSIDSGLFFERPWHLWSRAYTQTLEPRLFYLYVPERKQQDIQLFDTALLDTLTSQLFSENRFVGRDRIGDANQLTYALSSRLFDDRHGQEKALIRFGQAHFFEDRKVTLNSNDPIETASSSALFTDIHYRFTPKWTWSENIEWNPNNKRTQKAVSQLRYQPNSERVLNIGHRIHRFTDRDPLEQVELSAAWRREAWTFLGLWRHDLKKKRAVDTMFGIEYESCCWGIRVAKRRFLDTTLDQNNPQSNDFTDALFVQFVLKGLGNLGQGDSTRWLTESITGYTNRFNHSLHD